LTDDQAVKAFLLRFLPAIVALALDLLRRTWRVRRVRGELVDGSEGPVVLAFFHGDQVPMVALHARRGISPLASWSPDGEFLARSVSRLGYRPIRGSSSRGGRRAFLEGIRCLLGDKRHVAFAVDGPRGPRFVPHRGAVALAAATRRPLIFGVVVAGRAWHARSWDRLAVPLPLARVELRYGRMEPPQADAAAIDEAASRLGVAMRELAGIAKP
jgi:lysophospholipid acyltransferase (LPLAT)-like uncharacterized protein